MALIAHFCKYLHIHISWNILNADFFLIKKVYIKMSIISNSMRSASLYIKRKVCEIPTRIDLNKKGLAVQERCDLWPLFACFPRLSHEKSDGKRWKRRMTPFCLPESCDVEYKYIQGLMLSICRYRIGYFYKCSEVASRIFRKLIFNIFGVYNAELGPLRFREFFCKRQKI